MLSQHERPFFFGPYESFNDLLVLGPSLEFSSVFMVLQEHRQIKLRQARCIWGFYICIQALDVVLAAPVTISQPLGLGRDDATALGSPYMSKIITVVLAMVVNICLADVYRYHCKW